MAQTPAAHPSPDTSEAPLYQSPVRLYHTRDGRLVKEGDPDAHSLFVAAGGYVPFQLARKHGLIAPSPKPPTGVLEGPDVEVAARLSPPATTARKGPRETK